MHEYIGPAAILRDEAIALLGIEKFDSTLSHHGPPFETHHAFLQPREPFTWFSIRILRVLGNGPLKAQGYTTKQAKSRMAPVYRNFTDFTNAPASSRTTSNACECALCAALTKAPRDQAVAYQCLGTLSVTQLFT
jgi:hypothetical protein